MFYFVVLAIKALAKIYEAQNNIADKETYKDYLCPSHTFAVSIKIITA